MNIDRSGSFVDSVLFPLVSFFPSYRFPWSSCRSRHNVCDVFVFAPCRRSGGRHGRFVDKRRPGVIRHVPVAEVTRRKRRMTNALRFSLSSFVGRHSFPRLFRSRRIRDASTRLNCIPFGTSSGSIRYCFWATYNPLIL